MGHSVAAAPRAPLDGDACFIRIGNDRPSIYACSLCNAEVLEDGRREHLRLVHEDRFNQCCGKVCLPQSKVVASMPARSMRSRKFTHTHTLLTGFKIRADCFKDVLRCLPKPHHDKLEVTNRTLRDMVTRARNMYPTLLRPVSRMHLSVDGITVVVEGDCGPNERWFSIPAGEGLVDLTRKVLAVFD